MIMRLPAKKVTIKDLVEGKYVKAEGEWEPNFVITPYGVKVSRARILGTVVDKYENEEGSYVALTIDDCTETIRLKGFRDEVELLEYDVGDIVDVIGRVREYEEELYLSPEIVKKTDINWEILRKLEILRERMECKKRKEKIERAWQESKDLEKVKEKTGFSQEEIEAVLGFVKEEKGIVEEKIREDPKDKILKTMEKLDRGEGIDYEELVEKSGLNENVVSKVINELLEKGVLFEPKTGWLKRLA
jgi:hypothetical protein